MSDEPCVRPVADGDWDSIVAMESRAYTGLGLSEGRAALESRVRMSPTTCRVLDVGRRPVGYVLALPYPVLRYPDLERAEESAYESRNLHLHDLVIADDFRRRGLGRHLLDHLTVTARSHGYERISLVAVGGSETFWSARGFTVHGGAVLPDSYGHNAVYMSRPLSAGRTGEPEPTGVSPPGASSHEGMG